MTEPMIRDQGLGRVLELLYAIDGVSSTETLADPLTVEITVSGKTVSIEILRLSGDYAARKSQYDRLCRTIKALGISEGGSYVPPPPPRRGMTPQIRNAREKQKRDFEAWQDVWRAVRRAEKALDVEYEIAQMRDYY